LQFQIYKIRELVQKNLNFFDWQNKKKVKHKLKIKEIFKDFLKLYIKVLSPLKVKRKFGQTKTDVVYKKLAMMRLGKKTLNLVAVNHKGGRRWGTIKRKKKDFLEMHFQAKCIFFCFS